MSEGKAEKLFRKIGKTIDDIGKKLTDSETYKDLDMESRINELKKTKDKLEAEFHTFTEENKEAAKDIIKEIDEGIEKLKAGIKERFGNKEDKKR